MNIAVIFAGGSGQRMHSKDKPKQFLMVHGKPIIVHTIEHFQNHPDIDGIIVSCIADWIPYMEEMQFRYRLDKIKKIVPGGTTGQLSIYNGLKAAAEVYGNGDHIVLIHDGVRPLVKESTILENIKVAREKGNAMTVKRNIETVVVTEEQTAHIADFKNRDNTYTLTAPQSFRTKECLEIYENALKDPDAKIPLDTALLYGQLGREIHLVVEEGLNLKVTTPEDFYYLKSYLELQESINILGV